MKTNHVTRRDSHSPETKLSVESTIPRRGDYTTRRYAQSSRMRGMLAYTDTATVSTRGARKTKVYMKQIFARTLNVLKRLPEVASFTVVRPPSYSESAVFTALISIELKSGFKFPHVVFGNDVFHSIGMSLSNKIGEYETKVAEEHYRKNRIPVAKDLVDELWREGIYLSTYITTSGINTMQFNKDIL